MLELSLIPAKHDHVAAGNYQSLGVDNGGCTFKLFCSVRQIYNKNFKEYRRREWFVNKEHVIIGYSTVF